MRLIDADALEDVLVNHGFCYCGENEYNDGVADGFLLARDDVKEAPTIAAAEVRHGKLLRTEAYPHKLYCGECYNTLIPNDEAVEQNWMLKPKYCMYCGAKLDKEGTP